MANTGVFGIHSPVQHSIHNLCLEFPYAIDMIDGLFFKSTPTFMDSSRDVLHVLDTFLSGEETLYVSDSVHVLSNSRWLDA